MTRKYDAMEFKGWHVFVASVLSNIISLAIYLLTFVQQSSRLEVFVAFIF